MTDQEYQAMIDCAQRWHSAAMEVSRHLGNDSKVWVRHNDLTGKSDLDKYLMRRFGIYAGLARSVSNALTSRNLHDIEVDLAEFEGEEWMR